MSTSFVFSIVDLYTEEVSTWIVMFSGHFVPIQSVDSGPLSQRSACAEQYAQTKTNTNPSPDPNRYRRHCPDPNARIQKFIHYMAVAVICDSGPLR